MARTLVRNATIISVDPKVGDLHRGDILIEGSKIAEIAPSITAGDAEIVDATNMIAVPGFIDSHRHTWESLLRATGPDWSAASISTNGVVFELKPNPNPILHARGQLCRQFARCARSAG